MMLRERCLTGFGEKQPFLGLPYSSQESDVFEPGEPFAKEESFVPACDLG